MDCVAQRLAGISTLPGLCGAFSAYPCDCTAARAGIAPQYLSELERGRKDPSSEILAAVVGALGTSIAEISGLAHHDLSRGNATLMAA